METMVSITLHNLDCIREGRGSDGSDPYIWPAMVWIDQNTLAVGVLSPTDADALTVIKSGMRAGQSAPIPASVGVLMRPFDDDIGNLVIILAVALWQRNDTPDNVAQAGFDAYSASLRQAIADNLLALDTTDQAAQDAVIQTIKTDVKNAVANAISNALSTFQKIEVWSGLLTLDSIIDNSSTVFRNIVPTSFTISFGGSFGGRLLFYRDYTQNGTGDVDTPSVIGLGGWADFKFLFSGGDGIIYAVDQAGRLLFYRDKTQDGTGDVDTPSVIGLGGWTDFKFLFSGGNGIIYAVDQAGRLLFYRDKTQNGTGDVDTPSVIGLGGWADFKFLFSGGDGIIYAVDQAGRLLFYRDKTQDGTGDVDTPSVIGLGGWADFDFLFSAGNGIIYAVDQAGQLLFYRDYTQNGTGDVDTPSIIGLGGWTDFKFLFSGGDGIIYAVEKAANPPDVYQIDADLGVAVVLCAEQRDNVAAATTALNDVETEIAGLEKQFAQASAAEKQVLRAAIKELQQNQLPAAEKALAAANAALRTCEASSRARSG